MVTNSALSHKVRVMVVAGIRETQQAPHYRLQGVDLHRTVPWHCDTGCHAWILVDALESICYFATGKFLLINQ